MRGLREPRAACRSSPCSTGRKNASDEWRAEHRGAPLAGCAGTRRATVARYQQPPLLECMGQPPSPTPPINVWVLRFACQNRRGLTETGWRSRDAHGRFALLPVIRLDALVLHLRDMRRLDASNHRFIGAGIALVRCMGCALQAERAGVSGSGPNGAQRSAHAEHPTRGPKGALLSRNDSFLRFNACPTC